jgi:hypothetical protein
MPCGPLSFVVLDFDGNEGKKLYEDRFGNGTSLPITAMTPSGGYHAFFRFPADKEIARLLKNAVRILPGVDIRTHGGYVLVPSDHVDSRCWLQTPDVEPMDLPDWIIAALRKPPEPVAISESDGLPPGVGKGQRNQTTARLAGRYLAKGLSAEEAASILSAWNKKNSPPMPEQEVRSVVFNIAKKEREKVPIIEVVDSSELSRLRAEPPKKIIDPFLPAGSKAILAGWQGSYKSTLLLNWAVSIRSELPVFGRFDVSLGRVLYVDRENSPDLTNYRVEKISRGMNALRGGISFQFPKEKPDLANPRVREAYIRVIERERIDLAIFDSFLCFFNLRNENDNTEVRNILELVKEIPDRTGAAILFVDHAGKPSPEKARAGIKVTPRGASAKGDWADVVMTLEEREHEARKLRALRFSKTRFNLPMPTIILEVGPNLVFAPSGEDEICPVFTVRQVVEDAPGIAAMNLYGKLMGLTGCSDKTAKKSTARAIELGFIRREKSGRNVFFHPRGLGKSEDFPYPEGEEQIPLILQAGKGEIGGLPQS